MAARGTPSRDAAATPPAAASNGQILHQQLTPPPAIRRHLPFATMKPPFVAPDDYHRFSTPGRAAAAAADHLSEAVVIKSPVRLRISSCLDYFCAFVFCVSAFIFLNLA